MRVSRVPAVNGRTAEFELSVFDAPLSPTPDSDRTELARPNESVCLRGADGEHFTYFFERDEPALKDPGLTGHHLTFLQ